MIGGLVSVQSERDPHRHRLRRAVWDKALGTSGGLISLKPHFMLTDSFSFKCILPSHHRDDGAACRETC